MKIWVITTSNSMVKILRRLLMTPEVVGLVLFDYRLGVDSRRGLDAEALLMSEELKH